MKCKHCGEIHPDEFQFCPNTGNKIEPEKLVCKVCGSDNFPVDSKFCPFCGTLLVNETWKKRNHVTQNKYKDILHIWSPKGLFWVKCNEKWGIMDSQMKEIVPCCLKIEDYALEADDKFIGISEVIEPWNEDEDEIIKYGYIDYQGNQVIPCIYDRAFISGENDSFVLEKDGKCGVLNNRGTTLVPFKWDNIAYFSHGVAAVKMGNKCGYININGDIVIPLEYEETRNFIGAGFASVKREGKWGIIDVHNNVIVPFEYDVALTSLNEEECDNIPSQQLFLVSKDLSWSVIDVNGNAVCSIEGKYESANLYCNTIIQLFDDDMCNFYRIDIDDFIGGYFKAYSRLGKVNGTFYIRACVETEQYDENEEDFESHDYLIDIDENIIIDSEEYNVCETPGSINNLIRICQGNLYGVIDIKGNLIIPCEYPRIDIDYYGKSIIVHREYELPIIFNSDGTVLFSNN